MDLINYSNLVKIEYPMLSTQEFLKKSNIEIIYIDKFYENIEKDKWIIIDSEIIEWIGFNNSTGKTKYLNIIKNNFIIDKDYNIYNNEEFSEINENFYSPERADKNNETRGGALKKNLIVSPRCFKKSLMLIKTKKADLIRDYYVDIEDIIYKDYNRYQLEYQKQLLENKDKQLEVKEIELENEKNKNKLIEANINIDKTQLEQKEYIYGVTTKKYASQNLIKIGSTTKPLHRRLCGYNTGKVESDKYYVCFAYKCLNSEVLEKQIFSLLQNFKVDKNNKTNELYNIHFDLLKKILDIICNNDKYILDQINYIISNEQEKYLDQEPIIPNDILLKGEFICSSCNKDFFDKYHLNRHLNRENPCGQIYNCKKCDKNFNNINTFNMHLKNQCPKCELCHNNQRDLINHLNMKKPCDSSTDHHICVNCNKRFSKKSSLDIHLQSTCHKCGKCQHSPSKLKVHLNMKNPCNSIKQEYKCNKCEKTFTQKKSLENHLQFICPKCGICKSTLSELNRHLNMKNPCNELHQNYSCTNCNTNFNRNSSLENHKKYICSKCNKCLKTPYALKRHLERITSCI